MVFPHGNVSVAYLDTTIKVSKIYFDYVKNKIKDEGIKFYDRSGYHFVLDNRNRFMYASYRGRNALRGNSANYIILNDLNCVSEKIIEDLFACNFPVWFSRNDVTLIITLKDNVPICESIDKLINRYGCSHT